MRHVPGVCLLISQKHYRISNSNEFSSLPKTDTEARADPSITSFGSSISVSTLKSSFSVYKDRKHLTDRNSGAQYKIKDVI